jgi:hypothetical protein
MTANDHLPVRQCTQRPGARGVLKVPVCPRPYPCPAPSRTWPCPSRRGPWRQSASYRLAGKLQSAPAYSGPPMASATMVEVGFTAYGCDSEPTQTARSSCGSIPARAMALRAASIDIVATSSSRPGTAFSLMGRPALPPIHTRETSRAGNRYLGTYAP